MSPVFMTRIGPYQVGFLEPLTTSHLADIVKMLEQPPRNTKVALKGRRKPVAFILDKVGPVVIKHFARGGLIRFLVRDHYFRWHETRAQSELFWLEKVRQLGVQAPEPLAFVYKGNRVYTCALIMREIENHLTLADISVADMPRTRSLLPGLIDQTALLIQNRIHHVDFHPGNVLADPANRIWVIDFDKARLFSGSVTRLRDRYIKRWHRAVIRHGLPESLDRMFQDGLMEKTRELGV